MKVLALAESNKIVAKSQQGRTNEPPLVLVLSKEERIGTSAWIVSRSRTKVALSEGGDGGLS